MTKHIEIRIKKFIKLSNEKIPLFIPNKVFIVNKPNITKIP